MTAPQTHSWLPDRLNLANFADLAGLEIAAYAIFNRIGAVAPPFGGMRCVCIGTLTKPTRIGGTPIGTR